MASTTPIDSETPIPSVSFTPSVPRRRNRQSLSCGHCRFRKLKCDRAKPCGACCKAGDQLTCTYMPSGTRVEKQKAPQRSNKDALTERINRLENLLLAAVGRDSNASHSPTPSAKSKISVSTLQVVNEDVANYHSPGSNQLADSFGVMKVADNATVYLGGTHWVSIMSEIREFKSYLENGIYEHENGAIESQALLPNGGIQNSLLYGTASVVTKEELLSCIPSRVLADKLVARFFSVIWETSPIIHETTFRKEYIKHWDNPENSSVAWLGLLFSILNFAHIFCEDFETASTDECFQADICRKRITQCLVASNYTHPKKYTLETLIFYAQAEWAVSQDSHIDISLIIGIIVRLAMRMGLHRDPISYSITPFQGEMRSRVWLVIRQMDIIFSFQISLPATIQEIDTNCPSPRNLHDVEFDERSAVLPTSRSLSEPTGLSYFLTKAQIVAEVGKIILLTKSTNDIDQATVLSYGKRLEDLQSSVPPPLRISEAGLVAGDPLLEKKISIDRVYQVGCCILHQKFLYQARRDPAYLRHRRSCIDAAMTLLSHQATMYLRPNAPYPQNIKYRHKSTLTTHDFFIAGMAISLDLHYGFEMDQSQAVACDVEIWGCDQRIDLMNALEMSIEFWRVCKESSVEARKAFGMFSYILLKAQKAMASNPPTDERKGISETFYAGSELNIDDPYGMPNFDWEIWNTNNEKLDYPFQSF